MFYVFLIQSESFPDRRYVGFKTDLRERLATHDAGGSVHTAKYKPWKLIGHHAFADERPARELECYLKFGSGRAFARKRPW